MKKIIIFFILSIVIITGVSVMPVTCLAKDSGQPSERGGEIDLGDGVYSIEVSLSGGTGRASITSPAKITVSDKTAVAEIEWSSPNFDYMIVNGEQYLPVNTEGNSVFEIPVLAFDEEMQVIADTTAMSRPYEIEYTLTFHSDTIQADQRNWSMKVMVNALLAVAIVVVLVKGKSVKNVKKKQ